MSRTNNDHKTEWTFPTILLQWPKLSPAAFRAYVAILQEAGELPARLTISLTDLAQRFGSSHASAGRWVALLVDLGLLERIEGGRGRPPVYRLEDASHVAARRGLRIARLDPQKTLFELYDDERELNDLVQLLNEKGERYRGGEELNETVQPRTRPGAGRSYDPRSADGTPFANIRHSQECTNVNFGTSNVADAFAWRMSEIRSALERPRGIYQWIIAGVALLVETGLTISDRRVSWSENDLASVINSTNRSGAGGRYFVGAVKRRIQEAGEFEDGESIEFSMRGIAEEARSIGYVWDFQSMQLPTERWRETG